MAAVLLTFLVRKSKATLAWTGSGALLLVAAFLTWLAVVAPVNAETAAALASSPDSVPELWMALRARWEGGIPSR